MLVTLFAVDVVAFNDKCSVAEWLGAGRAAETLRVPVAVHGRSIWTPRMTSLLCNDDIIITQYLIGLLHLAQSA